MRVHQSSRRKLSILAVTLLGVSCARLDVAQPIGLRPGAGMNPLSVLDLADAAEAWNLEFGTSLFVTSGSIDQMVDVVPTPLACGFANGITSWVGGTPQIAFCNEVFGFKLYQVFLHELGHALNIKGHASSAGAVMGHGESFTNEDRELFRAANQGFVGRGGCSVVWHLGATARPPILVQAPSGPVAVLADDRAMRIVRVGETATPEHETRLDLTEDLEDLFAFPTPGGVGLVWSASGAVYSSTLDEPGLIPSRPTPLGLALSTSQRIAGAAALETSTFILVVDVATHGFGLYKVPPGKQPELIRAEGSAVYGLLGASSSTLSVLVSASLSTTPFPTTFRLLTLDADGALLDSHELPPIVVETEKGCSWGPCPVSLAFGGADDALVVTHPHWSDPIQILRYKLGDGLLGVFKVDLPEGAFLSSPASMTRADEGLVLAISATFDDHWHYGFYHNAYTLTLEPETLAVRRAWQRLSPTQSSSLWPVLASNSAGVVGLWFDGWWSEGEPLHPGEGVVRCLRPSN